MKRTICFLMVMMLMLCMQTAFAGEAPESFATSVDLWNYWQNERAADYDNPEPYPEYITGIWTDDNMETLTFGVTKDDRGEAGKKELLELIGDDSTVKFSYQTYPYNELWAIQLKLQEHMGDATGVFGIGIYEMENYLHIDIDKTNEKAAEFMEECFSEYGNRIVFEQSDGYTITAEEKGYADRAGGAKSWIWIIPIAVAMTAALILLLKKRQSFSAQTASGETVSTGGGYTAKQTGQLVKDSAEAPDSAVFDRICKELEK